jgi:flagellar motor switch protein FliN/FliY
MLGECSRRSEAGTRRAPGAVIELDATENDPLKIYANNTLIARGEVRVEDGQLRVEVTEKVRRTG